MGAVNNTSLRMQYVIAACLYIGQFGIGYNLGWTAPVLAKLQDPEQTPLDDVITDGMSSWIVSFIYFGTISGPYISGYLCNVIGRKPCLFLGGCAHFIASLTLAMSKNIAMILTGRVLSGLGNGIIYVTNLMYLGEMASTKIRGTLLTLTGLSSTFGTLIVYSVGPFVSYAAISWLSMTISGIYLIALLFVVPETATYHVIAGKKEAAIANLTLLGRQNDIEEVVTKASEKPRSKKDQMAEMFTVKSNRRALFIVLTLSVLQQMSGVIPLTAFVTIIFAMTGSTLEAHVSTIIVGLTQIFAASIAPLLVDRIGRKILLLVSTGACSLSMAALGTYFYLYNNGYAIAEDLQWLSLVSLMLFFVFYFSVYIGQFGIGYNLGWTAPVLAKLQDPEQTPLDDVITDGMSSWIVSFIYFGTISGPYISGYLCNVIGRKPCLFLGGCAHFIASLTLAMSKNIAMILTGRVLSGLGNGIIYVTNLMYLGEMASTKIRGTLLTLTGLSSTFGTLIVYSVGPFVSYAAISWLSMTISGIYLIALLFVVPETATYHVIAGKKEAAIANLTLLGRQNDIEEVVTKASEKPRSKKDQMAEMFTVKSNRRALFIVLTLSVLQQMSGVIPLTAFVTIIFAMTGSTLEAHVSTIIVGLTQIFAASIAPLLVDRIGRKILLLVSTGACSLSMAALGTYFYLYNNGYAIAEDLQWLSLVSLMLFFVFYFSGFGIIPNTFIGEMFTDTCRGFCSTFSATVGWIVGFAVTTSFGYILLAWGPSATFYVFTATCTIAFLFSATFVPETKGKSLLEIQEFLGK